MIGGIVRSLSRRVSSWSLRIAADSGGSTNPAAMLALSPSNACH